MIMENLSEILSLAESRGKALARPYRGELTPREALAVWQQAPEAKLVDVRTRAEWDWVGRVPGAIEIEWNQYPGGSRNPDFIAAREGYREQVPRFYRHDRKVMTETRWRRWK